MTDADAPGFLGANSGVRELDGFLDPFVDPSIRGRRRRRSVEALGPVLEQITSLTDARRSDPSTGTEPEEQRLRDKGRRALGAFDPRERSRVLDLLGFRGQLVVATFAFALPLRMPHGAVRATG
jgi:hypothetical protein